MSEPGGSGRSASEPDPMLRFDSPAGRRLLITTVLASGVAFLDITVVVVALPRMAADLDAGFAQLQWILDAYLLTLGALVLVGGALGDGRGLLRIFRWGLFGFAASSVLCALAPGPNELILARALQGVAAALLTPTSLAILSRSFAPADRGRAIGAWSGLAGASTAFGPFVGGWLVDAASWRWIFVLNLPALALTWWLARPAPPLAGSAAKPDLVGAGLTIVGLGLVVAPLIEAQRLPGGLVLTLVALGLVVLAVFVGYEARAGAPMLPPVLFRIRTFSVANAVTLVVYAALTAMGFLLTLALQRGLGFSALQAGAATVPVTLMLLLFSARVGALLPVLGARLLLTAGPSLMALGLVLLSRVDAGDSYVLDVLPALLVLAAGLVLVVAPVTSTTLVDVPAARQGVASGVSNATARVAGLLAIAVLPLASGLAGVDLEDPQAVLDGVSAAMVLAAGLCAVGAAVAGLALPARPGRGFPAG